MKTTRDVVILIIALAINLTGAYFGYRTYESSGQFWHFLVLLVMGMGFALTFIEGTVWYYGASNEKE